MSNINDSGSAEYLSMQEAEKIVAEDQEEDAVVDALDFIIQILDFMNSADVINVELSE